MSYSRWSNSIWYTYNSSRLDNFIRDEQVFTICAVTSFTYKELKEDINKCLDEVCYKQCLVYPIIDDVFMDQTQEPTYDESLKPTDEQKEELKGYMIKFINNVEKDEELK